MPVAHRGSALARRRIHSIWLSVVERSSASGTLPSKLHRRVTSIRCNSKFLTAQANAMGDPEGMRASRGPRQTPETLASLRNEQASTAYALFFISYLASQFLTVQSQRQVLHGDRRGRIRRGRMPARREQIISICRRPSFSAAPQSNHESQH